MAMHCQQCGAEISRGWAMCHSCSAPIKREGWFSRLLRGLGSVRVSVVKNPLPAGVKVNMKITEQIKIRDPQTGEMREYHSLDDVPAEFREKIRQARDEAVHGQVRNVISVTDASGKVQTYHSVEEMPPDLRAIYEKARSLSS
ncbi:MAG TPA: hypothetical protein VN887_08800 [Candidatus Angelobacter sp.]|nr:hypothetical protein [Candidatus Angelobacter sp.]